MRASRALLVTLTFAVGTGCPIPVAPPPAVDVPTMRDAASADARPESTDVADATFRVDTDSDGQIDAGSDGGVDVSEVSRADVGADVGFDVSETEGIDAGRDGGFDVNGVSRTDAGRDGGIDASGLPPIEVFEGPLPAPSRAPMGWGPLRVTSRSLLDGMLRPRERQSFAYSDRRVNAVTTERWNGSRWFFFEMTNYQYGVSGRLEGRAVFREAVGLYLHHRWVYLFNPDGTPRAESGEMMRSGSTVWVQTMLRSWDWRGGFPGQQRYAEAPALGRPVVLHWYHDYDFEPNGRLVSYLRAETPEAPPPRLGSFRRLFVMRPSGHVDREVLIFSIDRRPQTIYRYNGEGLIAELSGEDTVVRYLYTAQGRLQFIRTYVLIAATWTLTDEVELEHTDEGSDLTFSLLTDPLEQWRRDYYGRGDIVDRYRR